MGRRSCRACSRASKHKARMGGPAHPPADDTARRAVTALLEGVPAGARDGVIRGARLLDRVRVFPDAAALLPASEIGRIDPARQKFQIPAHLETEMATWIQTATTVLSEGWKSAELREKLAERHSVGSTGIYQAALRNYVHTLGQLRPIGASEVLADLFNEEDVYSVIHAWEKMPEERSGLTPQTMHAYAADIGRMLERNGCAAHENLAVAIASLPILREGRQASQQMSPATVTWCSALIGCEEKTRLFETQHWHYEREARAALEEAG